MTPSPKHTITLTPEEVERAVKYCLRATCGGLIQDSDLQITFHTETLVKGYPPEFTGATVEVLEP